MINDQIRFFGDGGAAKKESCILGVGYRNPDDISSSWTINAGQYATLLTFRGHLQRSQVLFGTFDQGDQGQ